MRLRSSVRKDQDIWITMVVVRIIVVTITIVRRMIVRMVTIMMTTHHPHNILV